MKRLEELARDSSALKPFLVPPMKALSNLVPELVNFGISVCSFAWFVSASLADGDFPS